eukprot:61792-Chlamydomonas_euryale.AAC.1
MAPLEQVWGAIGEQKCGVGGQGLCIYGVGVLGAIGEQRCGVGGGGLRVYGVGCGEPAWRRGGVEEGSSCLECGDVNMCERVYDCGLRTPA